MPESHENASQESLVLELQRQLAGCHEDNKRKTYAIQRSEIELQAAKDRIRALEKELERKLECIKPPTETGSGK